MRFVSLTSSRRTRPWKPPSLLKVRPSYGRGRIFQNHRDAKGGSMTLFQRRRGSRGGRRRKNREAGRPGKGELTNGQDLAGVTTVEGAFFIGPKRPPSYALSNCIPPRKRKGRSGRKVEARAPVDWCQN
ncbi:hypothetical protein KM043_006431 [Ampulex compressa]|nr:hypothetical protein KM043_006431 [Ampulex compressa]